MPNPKKVVSKQNETEKNRKSIIRQSDIPSCSIEEALKISNAIADQYAYKPVTPLKVAAALNVQPTTGTFRMLCGASSAYGLTKGSYNSELIELDELGLKIVKPLEEDSELLAKREALLKPRITREFLTKYAGAAIPRNEIAMNILHEFGVPKDRCEDVLKLIMDGAETVGFIQTIGEKKYITLEGTSPLVKKPIVDDSKNDLKNDSLLEKKLDVVKPILGDKIDSFLEEVKPSSLINKKVFITHGKNVQFIDPIKKLLAFGELEPVISTQQQSVSQPVPDKVMNDMRGCGAAIIHVDAEQKLIDSDAKEQIVLNPNVLIEIGAAMALYGRRFILLVKDGIKLPSNLQGLFEVRYKGDTLDGDATIKLLEAINDIKKHQPPTK